MLASQRAVGVRPFTTARPTVARTCVVSSAVVKKNTARVQQQAQLRTRSAEEQPAAASEEAPVAEEEDFGPRGRRKEKEPELKQLLPLPKPAHLVFIKPTVAVVAGMAGRSSVGLKMTAGENQLERYVIEYYARSVK